MSSIEPQTDAEPTEELAVAEVDAIRNAALVEQRRTQILDAALELFVSKGFGATTIRDICAASGVNQASIYDYVANKDDILRRLFNRMFTTPDGAAIAERRRSGGYPNIEDYLSDFYRHVWDVNGQAILLTYRVIRDLDREGRRFVLERDRRLVETVAQMIRETANLPDDDRRTDIVANLVVFLNAFMPLREWCMRDIDEDLIVRTVSAGIAAMIQQLANEERAPSSEADDE